jgi:mediator of RNA polymerase II transcription subunit 16
MILGNVKWALDLAKYLIDDLFEIADNLENILTDPNSLSQSGL